MIWKRELAYTSQSPRTFPLQDYFEKYFALNKNKNDKFLVQKDTEECTEEEDIKR